jgi:ribosomal protein S18 acetylase RimI-like enzyme
LGNGSLDGVTFRDAVPADREAIVALTTLTMQEHQARLPDWFLPREAPPTDWLDHLFNGIEDEKAVPFARLIVACLEERVIGHVLLLFAFSDRQGHGRDLSCHIDDISIAPDMRGQKVGTGLMQRAREVMQEEQATTVQGYVWRGNDASHKLFQTAQFSPDATVYSLRLRPPVPNVVTAEESRPSHEQSSFLPFFVLAIIVAALAWAKWGAP